MEKFREIFANTSDSWGPAVYLGDTGGIPGRALNLCQENGIWCENSLVARNRAQFEKSNISSVVSEQAVGLLDEAYTRVHHELFFQGTVNAIDTPFNPDTCDRFKHRALIRDTVLALSADVVIIFAQWERKKDATLKGNFKYLTRAVRLHDPRKRIWVFNGKEWSCIVKEKECVNKMFLHNKPSLPEGGKVCIFGNSNPSPVMCYKLRELFENFVNMRQVHAVVRPTVHPKYEEGSIVLPPMKQGFRNERKRATMHEGLDAEMPQLKKKKKKNNLEKFLLRLEDEENREKKEWARETLLSLKGKQQQCFIACSDDIWNYYQTMKKNEDPNVFFPDRHYFLSTYDLEKGGTSDLNFSDIFPKDVGVDGSPTGEQPMGVLPPARPGGSGGSAAAEPVRLDFVPYKEEIVELENSVEVFLKEVKDAACHAEGGETPHQGEQPASPRVQTLFS